VRKIHILFIALVLLFAGCQLGKNNLDRPKIDSQLPTVDSQTIKYISDINGIVLEWSPIDDPKVKGYKIFRSKYTGSRKKLLEVGTVDGRYSSHFYDKGLRANTSYSYRFATVGDDGIRSTVGDIIKIRTLSSLKELDFISSVSDLPRRVKVYWKPHDSHRVNGYIIYRADELKQNWTNIKELSGRLYAEYVDDGLKDKTTYRYKITATTFDDLRSIQSSVTTATTKSIPKTIEDIRASQDVAKRIELSWESIKDGVGNDIDYYLIYSSSRPNSGFSKIAKSSANSYIDMINEDGIIRYYKIAAVDIDNLEGKLQKNATKGSTRRAPKPPIITSASIDGGKAFIKWVAKDERAISSTVIKRVEQKWYKKSKIEYITDIRGDEFIDNKITPGIIYKYSIMSVDEFDVQSKPTREAKILIPNHSPK
jgi:fibronectin type 3 domain-containing protein